MSTLDPADAAPATTTGEWQHTRSAGANLATTKVPLGEELPIFCERCGYCLHGVAQHVCEHCTVRQFHCPECGHHQPINTLRPAFQKILGRIRAAIVTLAVLFRLNFFGWLLVAWVAMGFEWSYGYGSVRMGRTYGQNQLTPRDLEFEQLVAFLLFGLGFGLLGRMLLLRWRRGYLVGMVLATLTCAAIAGGALWRRWDRWETERLRLPLPFTLDFVICLVVTALSVTLGAAVVWGIWSAAAYAFLPRRTSEALLNWQRSQSSESAAFLARTGPSGS